MFDDRHNITQNVALYVKGVDHVSLLRAAMSFPDTPGLRAIPMLSFGLNYFFSGDFQPAAFKLTNVLIHVVTFVALWVFLRQLFNLSGYHIKSAYRWSLVFALIWAIHPLHVSTVLYVVQRMQMFATLFLLLALWQYLKMRKTHIQGGNGLHEGGLVLLFWILALMSKEDAILLPAYGLLLECFALNFRAAREKVKKYLVFGYAFIFFVGIVGFLFWVLPQQWRWDAYPGRDFNSYERLLTQGRVLLLHAAQIIFPLPDHMRFYYDDYAVSRGWMQPTTTLLSWIFILALLVTACFLRKIRPMFSLGIFWFFAGHFVTSNVLGLELVFEHRNYLPLIGIVLALGDVVFFIGIRLKNKLHFYVFVSGFLIIFFSFLGYSTWQRATDWGNPLRLSKKIVEISPKSSRAWVDLCSQYYDLSKGKAQSIEFGKAVEACQRGGMEAGSIIALANTVILKTTRGDIEQEDWDRLLARMPNVVITPESRGIPLSLIRSSNQGVPLSVNGILNVLDIADRNSWMIPYDYIHAARFILENTDRLELAYEYIRKAAQSVPVDAPVFVDLIDYLKYRGLDDPRVVFGKR